MTNFRPSPEGLSLQVSRFATRPLYLQVRDLLVQRILSGEWRPGSAIPTEPALMSELGVSLGTIRKALEVMEAERIVVRRQGRGTFVTDHSRQELAIRFSCVRDASNQKIELTIEPLNCENRPLSKNERIYLGVGTGQLFWIVHRHRKHMGRVYMTEECWLPAGRFPKMAHSQADYRICVLAQENGILLQDATEDVRAVAAGDHAEVFGVDASQPILRLDRVIYCMEGKPMEWRRAFCHLSDLRYSSHIR